MHGGVVIAFDDFCFRMIQSGTFAAGEFAEHQHVVTAMKEAVHVITIPPTAAHAARIILKHKLKHPPSAAQMIGAEHHNFPARKARFLG